MRRLLTLTVLATTCWSASAQAPKPPSDLGEVARRARARADSAKAVRTYTEDDLPRLRLLPINIIGELREEAEESTERESPDPETMWRRRFAEARRELSQAEATLARMQREYNTEAARAALLMDWSVVPCAADGSVFAPGYNGASNLTQLCGALNETRRRVVAARERLAGLEDELRRAGGLPGWARE